MKKARIGFIGAGRFISANHLLTARNSKIMDIAAIADLDQSLLDKHAAAMKVGYTTTDYKRLLNDPDIDMIVISVDLLECVVNVVGINAVIAEGVFFHKKNNVDIKVVFLVAVIVYTHDTVERTVVGFITLEYIVESVGNGIDSGTRKVSIPGKRVAERGYGNVKHDNRSNDNGCKQNGKAAVF